MWTQTAEYQCLRCLMKIRKISWRLPDLLYALKESSMSLNFRHAWMTVKFSLLSGYGVDRLNLSELGMKQDTRCSDERKQQSSRGII